MLMQADSHETHTICGLPINESLRLFCGLYRTNTNDYHVQSHMTYRNLNKSNPKRPLMPVLLPRPAPLLQPQKCVVQNLPNHANRPTHALFAVTSCGQSSTAQNTALPSVLKNTAGVFSLLTAFLRFSKHRLQYT